MQEGPDAMRGGRWQRLEYFQWLHVKDAQGHDMQKLCNLGLQVYRYGKIQVHKV